MLAEAAARRSASGAEQRGRRQCLARTAERLPPSAPRRLILTKLDEATGLGNLLPLLRTEPAAAELS